MMFVVCGGRLCQIVSVLPRIRIRILLSLMVILQEEVTTLLHPMLLVLCIGLEDRQYGNAIRALESLGTAAYSDDLAWAGLLKRHPQHNIPSFNNDIPSCLTRCCSCTLQFPSWLYIVLVAGIFKHDTFMMQSVDILPRYTRLLASFDYLN